MDKYQMADKLAFLLECAENGIRVKDIPGFEDRYAILDDGTVWSYITKKFLKPFVNYKGYHIYNLTGEHSFQYNKRANILVAEAFCEKPEGWNSEWDAAHIDSNPANNDYRNIKWQTRSQNLDTDHFREAQKKKIFSKVRCVETGEIFPSIAAAGRAIGLHKYGINLCLLGKQGTCGGYHWERVLDDEV